jgi:NAD(P)-dependent dehydrogenase (short-subunit alcohol dehydrogenase family)
MTRRHRKIRDKVVAITGGARGIGKATGEAFLRAGARVALGDIDVELVEKTAGIRRRIGRAAHFDVAFTGLDPRDRGNYHRRIGAS